MKLESLKGKEITVRCTDARHSGTLVNLDDDALVIQSNTTVAVPWSNVLYISSGDCQYVDDELHRRHLREAMMWFGLYAMVTGIGMVITFLLRWYL